jgi:hypothetical protein
VHEFPSPVPPKALAVPSDDGLGFHNAQGRAPIGPNSGELNPEKSVARSQSQATVLAQALQQEKLMTESRFSACRVARGLQAATQGQEQGSEECEHSIARYHRLPTTSTPSMRTDFLVGRGIAKSNMRWCIHFPKSMFDPGEVLLKPRTEAKQYLKPDHSHLWLRARGDYATGAAAGRSAPVRQVKRSLSHWFREWRIWVADFCRTMRQINTSASSTVRSAKSNPMDALQTC